MRHEASLDGGYFEDIFSNDEDPWGLESKPYEKAKFEHSIASIADRHYRNGFEVGCAQGALTHRLAPLCDRLLAVDVSRTALTRAKRRCTDRPNVAFELMTYPRTTPEAAPFDLVVLSEVAYYWDSQDIDRAAAHLLHALAPAGRVLLVHWTGETDYPKSGDEAVNALWTAMQSQLVVERAERPEGYRLDLWCRR